MTVYVAPGMAGRGVFAARRFQRGDVILQIKGPVYSGEELDRIGYQPGYPLQIDRNHYMLVDEPFVFCNHSCDPNAGLSPDLRLIATRDIDPEEEICFDYSSTMLEDNSWTMECGCKTRRCRGRIEDFDRLPESDQRRLREEIGVLPFILQALGLSRT